MEVHNQNDYEQLLPGIGGKWRKTGRQPNMGHLHADMRTLRMNGCQKQCKKHNQNRNNDSEGTEYDSDEDC